MPGRHHRPTVYAQQMSSVEEGLAIWRPSSGYAMDPANRNTEKAFLHIRPGDVGWMELDGSFTRFFNIHLSLKENAEQGMGPLPDDFQPIPVRSDIRAKIVPMEKRVYRSEKRWQGSAAVKIVTPSLVNGGSGFTFERNTGAILGWFDEGVREDLFRLERFYKEQLIKNSSNWLAMAETIRDLRLEDIIMVTGCTRVWSWVAGVVENESIEGNLSLSIASPENSFGAQALASIRCENSGGSFIQHGPSERLTLKYHGAPSSLPRLPEHTSEPTGTKRKGKGKGISSRSDLAGSQLIQNDRELAHADAINKRSDQSIFLRGFRMKKRMGYKIPKKLKAAAEPQDSSKDRQSGKDLVIKSGSEGDEGEEETWDHMHAALDYILNNSDADFAVVHENDLLLHAKSTKIIGELTTIDQVLKDCHPGVFVQEYGGILVGGISAAHKQQSALPASMSPGYIPTEASSSADRALVTFMPEPPLYEVEDLLQSEVVPDEELPPYVEPQKRAFSPSALFEHRDDILITGHTNAVNSVAFSPDGTSIVSGSADSTVRIWDRSTGEQICPSIKGHSDGVASVAFSPNGKTIVSGSWDRAVRLWAFETGQQVGSSLEGHTHSVTSVAFSCDGIHVASGSGDSSVRIWDVLTGEEIRYLEGHTKTVNSVTFSPDGTRVASGSDDNSVRIWDVSTVEEVHHLEGHTDRVTSVVFSPDGSDILSGSNDGRICIWDTFLGTNIYSLRVSGPVTTAQFSPSGKYFVSSSEDGLICTWESSNASLISNQLHPGVKTIAFSPDEISIVYGSMDGRIQVRPFLQLLNAAQSGFPDKVQGVAPVKYHLETITSLSEPKVVPELNPSVRKGGSIKEQKQEGPDYMLDIETFSRIF
ncbi:WD40-repeat-containing domain protein [Rhodocollybia butyracea]|uniref:WD40-repeat-containing domain protein n=1 Tax=Rhodocollybia butyracea TaxID=206335 RepID=A0A9P5U869_9AGAR|nr:WD40-repeat-containing domain protein [Rhodocollybia butyracea]